MARLLSNTLRGILLGSIAIGASGCAERLSEIGKEPAFTPVGAGLSSPPAAYINHPTPPVAPTAPYSLWSGQAVDLYTSQRALQIGDVMTVLIEINDEASLLNQSDRSRESKIDYDLTGSYEASTGAAGSGTAGLGVGTSSEFEGNGSTRRRETIRLSVAAIVTETFPNGNLLIRGSQEVRVNAELRVLTVEGIVRARDIGPNNTIDYERIAEARISYGGRGRLSEVQQPPYGQQIIDIVSPL